ncbi:MAG: tripartite tricarboxylate transporter permease [Pseudomonadota bacterium]
MAAYFAFLFSGPTGLISALVFGTAFGFMAGIAPGIGGRIGIILAIPFATLWDPLAAAVFLFAMHSVVHTSASIPAIAFALPSSGADAATVLDGYAMAKQGRTGEALGASLSASAIGGLIGAFAFLAAIPVARVLVTWFGPPEFLLLAAMGLFMVAVLSGRNLLAGLLSATLGFLAASIGFDVMSAEPRFTFGMPELLKGLDLAAVIGGLFVMPEMLARWQYDEQGRQRAVSTSLADVYAGLLKTFSHMRLVWRSSLYGIGVGVMPGVGSSVGVWLAYSYASRNTKSEVPFGKGAIAGVIATEAANNSKEGGAMVPSLFFGIPGSSSMAIMLGAFAVVGQPIGPSLLTTSIEVSFVLAATVALSNLIAIPMFFAVVPWIVRMAALKREHIVPFAVALALFAAAYQYLHWITLVQFLISGLIGIALKKLDWARAPFLLGFILGPLAETSYIQTSQVWGWSMFARPATLAMLAIFAILIFSMVRNREFAVFQTTREDARLSVPMAVIFLFAGLVSFALPDNASPFPLIICTIGLALAVAMSVAVVMNKRPAQVEFETFDNVPHTIGFCFLCIPLGIPLASLLYAFLLLRRVQTSVTYALGFSVALAALQFWLFSLLVDVWGEPLIIGYLANYLGVFG